MRIFDKKNSGKERGKKGKEVEVSKRSEENRRGDERGGVVFA
jgi:hypothetical protein